MEYLLQFYQKEDLETLQKLLGSEALNLLEYVKRNGQNDLKKEDISTYQNITDCLDTMAKYGSNRWWESEEPLIVAYYQLHEKYLLVDLQRLVDSISKTVNREIKLWEVVISYSELKDEVRKKFEAN